MSGRPIAFILAGAIAVYLLILGQIGLELVRTGEPAAVGLGIAILVFPLLGAWVVWRELRFGFAMQRMAEARDAEAPAEFESARERVEQRPADWTAWFDLGIAYDAGGDRRRAREAMRHADGLFRSTSRPE